MKNSYIKNMLITNLAKNQYFIITDDNIHYFKSYNSIICKIEKGIIYLDSKYWNYSATTNKYRQKFLNETTAETKKKIKEGIYILTDLN